jgi:copper/silver efflux system protein
VIVLLYLSMRGWAQTWLVLLSLPFAIAGSVLLLARMEYNLSTAVWAVLIAYQSALADGRLRHVGDVEAAAGTARSA